MRAMTDVVEDREAAQADGMREIRLRIPAKAEYITLCRLALTGLAQLRDINAYGAEGDGHVDITYELQPDRLRIQVVDDGNGFDPDEAPALVGDELSEGGLGISIIRTIADEFEIDSKVGARGSRLRFVKILT